MKCKKIKKLKFKKILETKKKEKILQLTKK